MTRPTGRAVRLAIEEQVAGSSRTALSLIDLSDVTVMDFSCADEIVAKLLMRFLEEDRPVDALFVFRGVCQNLHEPIQAVLERQELLAVTQGTDGSCELMGTRTEEEEYVWTVPRGARPDRGGGGVGGVSGVSPSRGPRGARPPARRVCASGRPYLSRAQCFGRGHLGGKEYSGSRTGGRDRHEREGELTRCAGTVRPRSEFMPVCPNPCWEHRLFSRSSRALLFLEGPVSLLRSCSIPGMATIRIRRS